MGSGESGRYYTSHGSRLVHHQGIIHSLDGEYTHRNGHPDRLKAGGHGQIAMEIMDLNGIEYHVVVTYPNGVRAGYVPRHKYTPKRTGIRQTWFPQHWGERDITNAAEHIMQLKSNRNAPDGHIIWGTWKRVRVGVIKRNGLADTVFPAEVQPDYLWRKNKATRKNRPGRI
ncbi:EndoU domain-containing protein [Bifidobacterium jacchi]|uniref:EndoU domain-containing protein n=1 Tax=Bifidobacterium jacchi TaxID=2490545 RepID=UPI0019D696AA